MDSLISAINVQVDSIDKEEATIKRFRFIMILQHVFNSTCKTWWYSFEINNSKISSNC